jgi:membrane fusion protein, multidrug efflux system
VKPLLWAALGLVVVAAGSVTVVVLTRPAPPAAQPRPDVNTAPVVRTTLVATENVDGTLGHGPPSAVVNRLPGTLTQTAPAGSTVSLGQPLYRVDDQPVVLLYGPVPAYRPMGVGTVGADVHQLEQGLSDLGYGGFTVDDQYTAATATAVAHWQEDLGVAETGTVDLGRVVFCPGPVRVQEFAAADGEPAPRDGKVLDYTSTARVVVADLDVTKRQLAQVGAAVTVTLPNRTQVAGVTAAIGTVATTPPSDQPGQTETPTVPVTVTIADQAALGDLDGAPVTVAFTSQRRENVLAVPVAALLALREGGYGVQLVTHTGSRIIAVQPGLFAGGLVEVTGDGLTEGARVGVAAS